MSLFMIALAAAGYGLMYLSAQIARGWLKKNMSGEQPELMTDPLFPGRREADHAAWFAVVRDYRRERLRRAESVRVAQAFWLGVAMTGIGILLFLITWVYC